MATTKLFRNTLGTIKGTTALVLTFVVGLVVGEFTFLTTDGPLYGGFIGLVSGAVAAGVFKGTKLIGKQVGMNKT